MMTKKELKAAIDRFCADEGRVLSIENLCALAGISKDTFRNVFRLGVTSITIPTQLRLEKALKALERGEIKVMRNPDKTVTASWRRKAEPEFARSMGLAFRGGRIVVKTGLVNVNDYTKPTFKEELER